MNENELFEKWRATEGTEHEDIERELVKALRSHAIAVCWNLLGERVPEVVDTAVAQALLYSYNFRGDAKFSTWFQTLVSNACRSYLRKKIVRRAREVPIGEDDDYPAPNSEPPIDVDNAIEHLIPLDREILRRKQIGMQETEIAEELGIHVKRVNSRWNRMKHKIMRDLNGQN